MLYIIKAIPTSRPSISYQSSSSGYEGETMKFSCYLSSLGDPQVRWSWFCGQEQMESLITNSTTYTYLEFLLSMKYHKKACYCRATSPSSTLIYNMTSNRRLTIYVYREWILWLLQLVIFPVICKCERVQILILKPCFVETCIQFLIFIFAVFMSTQNV